MRRAKFLSLLFLVVLIVSILILLIPILPVKADDVLIDGFQASNQNGNLKSLHPSSGVSGISSAGGTTFKPSGTYSLTRCKFYMRKSGTPSGVGWAYLYATTGDLGTTSKPTGEPLAMSHNGLEVSTISSSQYTWFEFTFNATNQYVMTDGVVYAIAFHNPETGTVNTSNYPYLLDDNDGTTVLGNAFNYHSNAWFAGSTYEADRDSSFEVYGILVSEGITISSIIPVNNTITLDLTPNFTCTPISNVSSTMNVTLYVDDVASGTETDHANNTEVTIACNHTLSETDAKQSWYFSVEGDYETHNSSAYDIGIGAYFIVPAVLVNLNATTEHFTYYLNASASTTTTHLIQIPDNNITLCGQYYTLDGIDNTLYGIYVLRDNPIHEGEITDIIIENLTINEYHRGIYLSDQNNTIIRNIYGQHGRDLIYLNYVDHADISNVTCSYYASGINLFVSYFCTIHNVTISQSYDGGFNSYCLVLEQTSGNNTIYNSTFSNNYAYTGGVYIEACDYNILYNNLFNCTNNNIELYEGAYTNYFNTSQQIGTRIYSNGSYIGGNFWAYPNGTGPSQINEDYDNNGFLDAPLLIGNNNYDYHTYSDKLETLTITFYLVPTNSYYGGTVWSAWQAVYATAWSTPVSSYDDYLDIGQYQLIDNNYRVLRGMTRFDTSTLPDRCVILSANLSLWFKEDHTDVDVLFKIQNWTAGADGISTDDFDKNGTLTFDDGNFNTTGITIGEYNNIVFDNFTIISKSGYTDLFLRQSKDISKTAPVYANGKEWMRIYAENGRELGRLPKLVVTYENGLNSAPEIAEFDPDGTTQYNDYNFLLNTTILDTDGIADFTAARVALNGSLILQWQRPDTFSEYSDPNDYCTLHDGSKTEVNATAYRLSWNITLASNYLEGYIDVFSTTIVFDETLNGTNSHADLFFFNVREWLTAENWILDLAGKTWFTAEIWNLVLATKRFMLAESWELFIGERVYLSTKQIGLMLLIAGLACVFLPIAIIAYKRPSPDKIVVFAMIIIMGLGLLLGATYL